MGIEKIAHQILTNLQTGILICDAEEKIVFANPIAKKIVGENIDNQITLQMALMRASADVKTIERIMSAIHRLFTSREKLEPQELTWKNGQKSFIHCTEVITMEDEGREYCLLSIEDASPHVKALEELKRAKEQAEQAVQKKTVFLKNFSYEVRTSLNAIVGYGQLLQDELMEGLSPDQQYYVNSLQWGSTQLNDTITRIYDLSRIDGGEYAVNLVPHPLHKAFEETVLLLQPLAEAKKLEIHLDRIPENINVLADINCLSKVLTNLIDNAIKFTDSGFIAIKYIPVQQFHIVRFQIQDTGVGINAELLPYIFEPYGIRSRGDSTRCEESTLNMALTKRYVELMNGTIEVESAKDKGTTFSITLLRSDADASVAAQETPIVKPVAAIHHEEKPLVLLVEDHEDAQMLVKAFLHDSYNIMIASDADEAIRILEKNAPACILMDVALQTPQGGLDLTLELRMVPKYYYIPIIALTAFAMPGDKERFMGSGMNDYLAKPYKKGDLLAILEKWVPRVPCTTTA